MKKLFTSLVALLLTVQTMVATTVTLTEANTLQTKLEALALGEFPTLTIAGPLGAADLAYIRTHGDEFHLQHLDLSGATLYGDNSSGSFYLGYTKTVTSSSTGFSKNYSYYYYISPTGQNYDVITGDGIVTNMSSSYYHTDLPYAFSGMTTLQSIKLPKGMNGIGEKCFDGCTALSSVTPTDEIINVDKDAFANSGIAALFTTHNGVVYYGNYAMYPVEAKTNLTFQDGTTLVADRFMSEYATTLTSVAFPSSLITIGYKSFADCTSLSAIGQLANVKYICDNAFYGCSSLGDKSLTLPASIVKVGQNALSTLGSITFAATDNIEELHTNAIPTNCTNAETIDGITYIGTVAFSGAATIEKETLWLREGTRIVAGGFFRSADFEGLKALHLPNTVTRLNYDALFNYRLSTTGTSLLQSHAIKDVYVHSKTFVELDAPITSQYRVTFHLLKSLQEGFASLTGCWANSATGRIKFDLNDVPEDTYSVAEVLALFEADNLPGGNVYVKGFITSISTVDMNYGNATYYINDEKGNVAGQFYIWRGYYLNSGKFTATDQIGVGDEVVICGKLKNYNGTYAMAAGNYIHSIVKNSDPVINISNTPDSAYSVAMANELIAAGQGLDTKVYVTGYISSIDEVSASFGNATYYISDAVGDSTQLMVYRGRYLENEKFTTEEQIKVGDKVIVYGKLLNYNGTYEIGSGNYIYAHNGITDYDEATGVDEVPGDVPASNASPIYDLQGRRLQGTPTKGIYIVGGKKMIRR